MAEISQIKLPNGDVFDLVDEKSNFQFIIYISDSEITTSHTFSAILAAINAGQAINAQLVFSTGARCELTYMKNYMGSRIYFSYISDNKIHIITFFSNGNIDEESIEIPQVYSSSNLDGYLTMDTLPIYNGTVE